MRRAGAGTPSIDAYLDAVVPGQRAALQRLRKSVQAAAPGAEECFYYGMPAFRFEGKALVAFAAARHHCALYPLSGRIITAHRALLARFETSKGTITVELWPDKAPNTVKNFVGYVLGGHYDGTIFHRVIKGFMIQGGGYAEDLQEKPTGAPVKLEAKACAVLHRQQARQTASRCADTL